MKLMWMCTDGARAGAIVAAFKEAGVTGYELEEDPGVIVTR